MCSLETELQRFSSSCAEHIRRLDVMRARSRFQRGLAIKMIAGFGTYNSSGLGLGHTLVVAYKLFDLCVSLKRYCYLQLYDSRAFASNSHPHAQLYSNRLAISYESSKPRRACASL